MAADHLDGRLQRNRVHEVHTEDFVRAGGSRTDPGDGDHRGVCGEDDVRGADDIQPLVHASLDVPVLCHVLDDEIHGFESFVLRGAGDPCEDGAPVLTRLLCPVEQPSEPQVLADLALGTREYLVRPVHQDDVVA